MDTRFVRLLEDAARRFSDKPLVVWEDGALTGRELLGRAGALADGLAGRGVKPGDTVALAIGNRWSFPVAVLGLLELGATIAPLDMLLKPDEQAAILADLQPAMVVRESEVYGITGDDGRGGGRSETPQCEPQATRWPRRAVTSFEDRQSALVSLILYTSGSTGRPKGALLSDEALSFANRSWAGPVMALTPDDVVLAVLPFAHSFGLNGALLAPLLRGATVVVLERFSPEGVVESIRRHRVTVFPGVATMFRRVLDAPGLDPAALAGLRIAVSGAAPCPWSLAEEWRARTGVRIVRGYGMTELFRPISYLSDDPTDLPDGIGRPVPGVEVRIADDAGQALPPGEVGELWIRSPAAMTAYHGAPEETRQVLREGWFLTGDLASLTPAGYVKIVGRKRERILRGGYSVFPQEVEAALLSHPAIAEAAVVGVAHPELGEEVAAFVALRPGARAGAEELIAYCRERLAGFKYPRTVTILDALPKASNGKIVKSGLTPASG